MPTHDRQICNAALAHPAYLHESSKVADSICSFQTQSELLGRLRAEKLPWTELMDRAMLAAHEEYGATAADVQAACAKVPMHPHMQEASVCLVNSVYFKTVACTYCTALCQTSQ